MESNPKDSFTSKLSPSRWACISPFYWWKYSIMMSVVGSIIVGILVYIGMDYAAKIVGAVSGIIPICSFLWMIFSLFSKSCKYRGTKNTVGFHDIYNPSYINNKDVINNQDVRKNTILMEDKVLEPSLRKSMYS
jgi:hypothetical protein